MYFDADLDLQITLIDSAQSFSWTREGDAYIGRVGRYPVAVRLCERGFEVLSENCDVEYWRNYFDLNRDYIGLRKKCEGDEFLLRAYEAFKGLHVLNQPVWDTVVSFIISANNNVKRIRGLVDRLCAALGEVKSAGGAQVSLFPTPERLAEAPVGLLREMGMGYRAPYLIETARAVADGFDLDGLRQTPYDDAFKRVTGLKGVGPKVADCVLLFSCGQSCAVPVDVWMERALRHYEPECSNRAELKRCAQRLWGDDAGILQQYLFHAARTGILTA